MQTPFTHSSPSSRKQQAAAIIQAIEQCLNENDCAGYNPAALRRMQGLIRDLQYVGGPFGEKPGSIEHWSEVFWSQRKHARWDTAFESGADRVRQNIRQDLGSLRSLNRQMQE